jgi:hypothetical protein
MKKLSNRYEQCELLNLGYGPKGRGPFVVRQDGYPPGSTTLKADRFLLRKDGTWVLNLAVFALPEEEKEKFIYESRADAVKALQALKGDPVIEENLPAGRGLEDLKAAAQGTLTGLWGRIQSAKASRMPS